MVKQGVGEGGVKCKLIFLHFLKFHYIILLVSNFKTANKSKLKMLGEIKGKYVSLLKSEKKSIPTLTTNNKSRAIRMNVNGKKWPP